jgi:hypothetical protein
MQADLNPTPAEERTNCLGLCLRKAYGPPGAARPAVDLIRLILKLSRVRRGAHDPERRPPTPLDRPMSTMPAPSRTTVRMAGW